MNLFLLQTAVEQTTNTQPSQGGGIFGMLLPMILMFGVIYLMILKPQQKQKKEHQAMLNNLKINDKVITSSGIIGKITNIKEDKNILVIRVDETTNTKIEFQKSSIVGVIEKEEKNA
ncbi:MAG: preprotein translocase subunit YajC [Candidatus Cloacimonetes bacterium]|jgi:preprotein translocase subunit YajC|nr:preprotein translocase subunit YajC [Candidatus Cloacimonadota bacterium]MDD4155031.1 preprotein translocase subunit YajC [Candidatus Cloacimonadota bacterium]